MKNVTVRATDPFGNAIFSATAQATNSSVANSTIPATGKKTNHAMPGVPGGMLEIELDGQQVALPITLLERSPQNESWQRPAMPAPVAFQPQFSPNNYANFDADAAATIHALGAGLNFGQTWDTIGINDTYKRPGAFRNCHITVEHLRRTKAAGFQHVRLPIKLDSFADTADPYSLDFTYLNEYFDLVDYALSIGLRVIIDNHNHFKGILIKTGTGHPLDAADRATKMARNTAFLTEMAQEIANRGYASDDVLFELENEPNGDFNADWNDYWPGMLASCRAVNANTIFLIGGWYWNNPDRLQDMVIDTGDRRTALVAHCYEPHSGWTHATFDANGPRLWAEADKAALQAQVDTCVAAIQTLGRPVVVTEIGARAVTSAPQIAGYLRDARNKLFTAGLPFTAWNAYGDFPIFHPTGMFVPFMSEAITGQSKSPDCYPESGGLNDLDLSACKFGWANYKPMYDAGTSTGPTVSLNPNYLSASFDKVDITVLSETKFRIDAMPGNAGTPHLILPFAVMRGKEGARPGKRFSVQWDTTGNQGAVAKLLFSRIQAGISDQCSQWPIPKTAFSQAPWGNTLAGQVYEYTIENSNADRACLDYYFDDVYLGGLFLYIPSVAVGDEITLIIKWLDE